MTVHWTGGRHTEIRVMRTRTGRFPDDRQGTKRVLQAVYFLLMARSLGPSQYGAFVAITAMTGIISLYVGLGSGILFLKNVRSGKRAETPLEIARKSSAFRGFLRGQ
jgi:hypothetical protein